MKRILAVLILQAGMSLLLSCAIVEPQATAGPTVHTGLTDFIEHTVTLRKGEWLTLEASVTSTHNITNGSWVNGVAHPNKEAGAPAVNQTIATAGERVTLGLFPTGNVPSLLHHSPWNEPDRDRPKTKRRHQAQTLRGKPREACQNGIIPLKRAQDIMGLPQRGSWPLRIL